MTFSRALRLFLAVCTLTGMLTVVSTQSGAGAASRTIALGMDTTKASNVQVRENNLTKVESEIGHHLAFTRDFLLWNDPFPTAFEDWLGQRGTEPMISVKSALSNGTQIQWSALASAQPGSTLYQQIVSWADRIRDYGYPVYFTFNHEPEAAASQGMGTPADYIAAWRHIHDVFATEGASNVKFMWIMTDWSFRVPPSDRRYAWDWYPGDAYVDGIAADAYNWFTCRSAGGQWAPLAKTISGFVTFGAQHPSKPMWLTEFASVEDPADGTRKADWITTAQSLLQQPAYSQIAGVAYFNINANKKCVWPIETSAAATAAMRTLAQDPYFQGSVDAVEPPPPPPPASSSIEFVGASSTTGNTPIETVDVPAAASAGDTLVMIATSSYQQTPAAPAGWTQVAAGDSPRMGSAVWERTATAGDPGSSVAVDFGGQRKASVEVLAYSGADAANPVVTAVDGWNETSTSTLTTPTVSPLSTGQLLLSYWATRTSDVSTITPPDGVTTRSAEAGAGGAQITSVAADSASGSGGLSATVSPAVQHSITWSVVLAPAA